MFNTDCVFCKIIAGEIPSFKLCEDERTYSMMDINPFNDGHCLVITKAHSVNIQDAEGEDLAAVLPTVQKIARVLNNALYPEGINII